MYACLRGKLHCVEVVLSCTRAAVVSTYRSYWQSGDQDGKAAVDQESEKAIEKEGEAEGEAESAKSSDITDRASTNNTGNARGNRSATNGDGERRDDDEYVTEEMDAELAKHFGDVAKNTMFQIRSKEKDTSTDEADSGTNETAQTVLWKTGAG